MSPVFEMSVESDLWGAAEPWDALIERALIACAEGAGAQWRPGAVSVLLTDDAAIRTLNQEWRGQDKPTNVLSFPAAATGHPEAPLGDVAIAFETAQRESKADGKRLEDHVAHLLVHGTLHLLGYDHDESADAERMEDAERRILQRLGIADPYAGSDLVTGGSWER